jgi:hypothetical protein
MEVSIICLLFVILGVSSGIVLQLQRIAKALEENNKVHSSQEHAEPK